MADIKQIEVDGVLYDLKDATARSSITTLGSDVSLLQGEYTDLSTTVAAKADASAIVNFKNITISDLEPTDEEGSNGDVWITYEIEEEEEEEES